MGSSSSEDDSSKRKRLKKQKKKEKKSKKHKKEKKNKHKKSSKKYRRRSSDEGSSSSASYSDSQRDEWVEKILPETPAPTGTKVERDDWMNFMTIATYSKEPKPEEKQATVAQYDPKTSVRELNPHWKNGGSGLPCFRRPVEEDEEESQKGHTERNPVPRSSGPSRGWRKTVPSSKDDRGEKPEQPVQTETKSCISEEKGSMLTDQQLNDLGAKIIKAEIMGNTALAASLKDQMEKAKSDRARDKESKQQDVQNTIKRKEDSEDIQFTVTKSSAEQARHQKKQKRYQQHLPPGSLADKFRSERYENDNMDAEFLKVSSKLDREASNLENIFDHSRATSSTSGQSNEEKVVREMNKFTRAQADCDRCINSSKFLQDTIVSMGTNVFLAVPSWKALQTRHCLIVPISHYPALTHMDEDVFQDLTDTCKAVKRMFAAHKQEVIFFETVRYINRNPHTYVQCVPADNYEMAPFYFKKAILESETEWAMNKKLHPLRGLEIRKTVPKGLPYFWVNFNLENGFAHVIEDQEDFPVTFASETIAGILGLETRDWRKPGREHNPRQRVQEFQRWWKEFDNLTKNASS
ncbi:CWF19-like protein 2 homolog [Uranotaenia lowii]|uniref:CWF19-like protein 2 homolog n=1 Tax=Uranotaenia lowii TaxID=190385 RepID=UPI002478ECA9|nr:CWF19-like protein 2 homolog [Uranotaenia lowii]